ncbi:MAG TPA: adenylosuccinate synthase [Anaerolineales bacterium]|nr:adenylosuccinate synthase [Anaerolineales bacterium]
MSVTVVIGAQWGDEAKGKIVDLLSQEADIVGRFNGGDNAGHTVVNQYGTFKLRLTPNGFSNPRTICVIGPGVVVNLATLIAEIETIRQAGISLDGRLWVSPRCHVVMPYHPLVEGIYERAKGAASTGTTGRGMGPVYADKVSYNGIRLADLADEAALAEKLGVQLKVKNALFKLFNIDELNLQNIIQEKQAQFAQIKEMVREPFGLVQEALRKDARIILEAAQGSLLDNDWGTYPFCTASTTIAGGAAGGLGIAPRWVGRVIGVAKAYTTRVGAGPFPTELLDQDGEALRQAGAEFGTVTGRPRRCGWFDAELVRFTAQLSGMTEVALTKLDVLDGMPKIKIGVGYCPKGHCKSDLPGSEVRLAHYWEGDARWLEAQEPEYIEVDGWMESTKDVRAFEQLPKLAQAYVRKVEQLIETPVGMVSTGPEREAIIPVPR